MINFTIGSLNDPIEIDITQKFKNNNLKIKTCNKSFSICVNPKIISSSSARAAQELLDARRVALPRLGLPHLHQSRTFSNLIFETQQCILADEITICDLNCDIINRNCFSKIFLVTASGQQRAFDLPYLSGIDLLRSQIAKSQ